MHLMEYKVESTYAMQCNGEKREDNQMTQFQVDE